MNKKIAGLPGGMAGASRNRRGKPSRPHGIERVNNRCNIEPEVAYDWPVYDWGALWPDW